MRTSKLLVALAVTTATVAATSGVAQAHELSGFENYTSTSWGRVDHTFRSPDHPGTLHVKLRDAAADGSCVYVDATVRITYGNDSRSRIGRVCGAGSVQQFEKTWNPLVGTSVRGVDVHLCKEVAYAVDPCYTEYNSA